MKESDHAFVLHDRAHVSLARIRCRVARGVSNGESHRRDPHRVRRPWGRTVGFESRLAVGSAYPDSVEQTIRPLRPWPDGLALTCCLAESIAAGLDAAVERLARSTLPEPGSLLPRSKAVASDMPERFACSAPCSLQKRAVVPDLPACWIGPAAQFHQALSWCVAAAPIAGFAGPTAMSPAY